MSDIGIMHDEDALQVALQEARSLLNLLELAKRRNEHPIPIATLERASFTFHQLSTLLDLAIQEQLVVARPQEEAHDQLASDPAPVDGISSGDEATDDGEPPTMGGLPIPRS